MDGRAYEPLAEIEVDQVKPERQGFMLTGQGPDNAEYQLDLRFGMPLDPRTRTVLGELLSHSDLIISRRAPGGLAQALRQRRNRAPQRQLASKSLTVPKVGCSLARPSPPEQPASCEPHTAGRRSLRCSKRSPVSSGGCVAPS